MSPTLSFSGSFYGQSLDIKGNTLLLRGATFTGRESNASFETTRIIASQKRRPRSRYTSRNSSAAAQSITFSRPLVTRIVRRDRKYTERIISEAGEVPKGFTLAPPVQLALSAVGIYACYLRYGVLQERIYSTAYDFGEMFTHSGFLLALQTATNAVVAFIVLAFTSKELVDDEHATKGKPERPTGIEYLKQVPWHDYALVSMSYVLAMLFSFSALRFIPYPLQALAKACKMIPVMLMGFFIGGKRYKARQYATVSILSAGIALFSWKAKASTAMLSPVGLGMLAASLFMDGVTAPLQEKLVASHKPSTHMLMFLQNVLAFVFLVAGLSITGEGVAAVGFLARCPHALRDMMMFSIISAVGQNFIFYTVRNFGALAVSAITTTRKLFTVLISIVIYKHALVGRQWLGLAFVFAAVFWEAIVKYRSKGNVAAGQNRQIAS